tara:strand:+ start:753 stop:1025 length:273 start_codon:yes stop_codon:yes gene_type:complete
MNINENFSSDQPKHSNEIMGMAMQEIHDILIEPMQDKLTPQQDSILAIVGLTFKVMAEKATAFEKMEQDGDANYYAGNKFHSKENDFNRN